MTNAFSENVTEHNDGPAAGNGMFASTNVLLEAVGICTDMAIEGQCPKAFVKSIYLDKAITCLCSQSSPSALYNMQGNHSVILGKNNGLSLLPSQYLNINKALV